MDIRPHTKFHFSGPLFTNVKAKDNGRVADLLVYILQK